MSKHEQLIDLFIKAVSTGNMSDAKLLYETAKSRVSREDFIAEVQLIVGHYLINELNNTVKIKSDQYVDTPMIITGEFKSVEINTSCFGFKIVYLKFSRVTKQIVWLGVRFPIKSEHGIGEQSMGHGYEELNHLIEIYVKNVFRRLDKDDN